MAARRSILAALIAVVALGVAENAAAQVVRGTIVDGAGRPLPGVVAQLTDSAAHVVTRALSNDRGDFRLTAPTAGIYRIHALRIGFRPVTSQQIRVQPGADVIERLIMNGLPVGLDTIRVASRSTCAAMGDSAAATFRVWEQARASLIATTLGSDDRAMLVRTISYDRTLDPDAKRVRSQNAGVHESNSAQPWLSLPPDSLHRLGYVLNGGDNSMTYRAPGLDMLESDLFLDDHCFGLTRAQNEVGLTFQPRRDRSNLAEISGTLWLDRTTSELRRLDFKYVNLSPEEESAAGGDMEFVRMAHAGFAVQHWEIRMPVIEQRAVVIRPGEVERYVAEVRATGGDLVVASRGNDTLWSQPRISLTGTVRDSTSGRPTAGARIALGGTPYTAESNAKGEFGISNVLPGVYRVEVRTASLDSVSMVHQVALAFADDTRHVDIRVPRGGEVASHLCRASSTTPPGMVLGAIAAAAGDSVIPVVTVTAAWVDTTQGAPGSATSTRDRAMQTHSDAGGLFRFCGLPLNTTVSLSAASSGLTAAPVDVHIPLNMRLVRAQLFLDRAPITSAFKGAVLVDATKRPIAGAEVSLPDATQTTVADADGRFFITGIPAGPQRVVIRHIGYSAIDTTMVFGASETVDRSVYLAPVTTLDSVVTTEKLIERQMISFEDHRRVGVGHFITRAQLAETDGLPFDAALHQLPAFDVVMGVGGAAWVVSTRAPTSLKCSGCYTPTPAEGAQGMKKKCYVKTFVNGALANPGNPTPGFDVNGLRTDEIEAVEFYSNASELPVEYGGASAACGVLVVWTRR